MQFNNLFFHLFLLPTGKPDQPDPHQVQPDRVNQVPRSHHRVNSVYRWSAAGLHRGLLPPAPLPPQAQGKAHQSGNRDEQRCYCHLPGRSATVSSINLQYTEIFIDFFCCICFYL